MKKYLIAGALVSTLIIQPVLAKQTFTPYQNTAAQTGTSTLKGSVYMVPAGITIPTYNSSEINTASLFLGQSLTLNIGQDYYYNGKLLAPAGSIVNGTVIQLKKASFATRNGLLQVRFTSIVTPEGKMIPISGGIKTDDNSGVLHGGTKKETAVEYAKDVGIGAAGGAILGTVMGPLSGGKVGKGAAYGTAVGAGIGLGKSVIDKGADVVIPANSNVPITIDQPITLSN